ncbi:MAG: class A beta-lactamase [Hyphomonadaceae bacterium]
MIAQEPVNDLRFAAIEARIGGRVGVTALNTAGGAMLVHRADERFAMCSTFKWLLAAQMLQMAQSLPSLLEQRVRYTEGDLLEYAPVARENLARGWMSIEELCAAAVVMSDNTAANLLLVGASGPAGFTSFLRANGDAVTRLDRTEPTLNDVPPGDERDTTTPEAMARTLARFLTTDEVLAAAGREKLIGWMVDSPTGRARLRAGLPTDWRTGDKTGTWNGEPNASNDVAISWPPGRTPIVIASYLSASTGDPSARNVAHAEIARVVAEEWR